MNLRIIPIYYLGLITYGISTYSSYGNLGVSFFNALSHFMFLNGMRPAWFGGFLGGSGYIGILVLMWFIYPVYVKRVRSFKEALFIGASMLAILCVIFNTLIDYNNSYLFDDTGYFYSWIRYINRACVSFILGNILYWVVEENILNELSKRKKWFVTLACLTMIIYRASTQGSDFNGVIYTLTWLVIILVNYKDAVWIIDNPILEFFGRYSMEMFITHIVLHYVLVINQNIMAPGIAAFIVEVVLTILMAPLLNKYIQKPIYSRLNAFILKDKGII